MPTPGADFESAARRWRLSNRTAGASATPGKVTRPRVHIVTRLRGVRRIVSIANRSYRVLSTFIEYSVVARLLQLGVHETTACLSIDSRCPSPRGVCSRVQRQ